jgi:DNA primase
LDVIAMHRAGFENSAAPQGTAFTEEQARMIKRYTDRLYLAFDSDGAGIKAAVRAVEIALPEGFEIKVICYPEGQDPDDIIRNQGIEAIKPLVEGAIDFFDFLFRRQCLEFDATSPVGKGRIVGEMIKYLAKVESQVTRTAYASELAIRLKLPQESVFNELNREKRQRNFKNDAYVPVREQDSGSETSAEQGGSAMEELPGKIRKAEETLLELSLTHGTIAKQLESELPARMISNTPVGKALEQVILFTVNGEWEFAEKHLRTEQMNLESPDTTLSKILNAPHEHTHAFQEKAASDCIKLIKSYQIQLEIDHLLQKIKNTDSADDKKTMLKQFNLLSKSLAELNRPEKKK